MSRQGSIALFALALAVAAAAARAQAPAAAIEADQPAEIEIVARLDDELSKVAAALGACVQDGGAPQACLCAARPALAALMAQAEGAMTARPRWAEPGAVVVWRNGAGARSMSVPGVRLEAARGLAACRS